MLDARTALVKFCVVCREQSYALNHVGLHAVIQSNQSNLFATNKQNETERTERICRQDTKAA